MKGKKRQDSGFGKKGKEEGEKAGKNILFFLVRRDRIINFIAPKVKREIFRLLSGIKLLGSG